MSKHTPGPWELVESEDGGFSIETNRHDTHRHCVLASRAPWPSYAETSWANGDLIAAAPDLLEALEDLIPYLEEDPDDDGDYNGRVQKARAAIAKAKGEA